MKIEVLKEFAPEDYWQYKGILWVCINAKVQRIQMSKSYPLGIRVLKIKGNDCLMCKHKRCSI